MGNNQIDTGYELLRRNPELGAGVINLRLIELEEAAELANKAFGRTTDVHLELDKTVNAHEEHSNMIRDWANTPTHTHATHQTLNPTPKNQDNIVLNRPEDVENGTLNYARLMVEKAHGETEHVQ